MRDLSYIFDATPLKNRTFKIYGTTPTDKRIPDDAEHVYYSPYFIMSFAFDTRNDTKYNLHCCTHDIAHAIDLWERGGKTRLLVNDFGWRIKDDDEKWPRNDMFKELRTITLQGFLTNNIFGWDRLLRYQRFAKRHLRSRVKPGQAPFFPTKIEWEAKVAEYERHNERVGIKNYMGMWQDLCKFVKANRT